MSEYRRCQRSAMASDAPHGIVPQNIGCDIGYTAISRRIRSGGRDERGNVHPRCAVGSASGRTRYSRNPKPKTANSEVLPLLGCFIPSASSHHSPFHRPY